MQLNKIILADDHSFIRLGLKYLIKKVYPKVEILEVENGVALVEMVKAEDCDLVISDLDMEEKNGLEALEEIRTVKPHLPVLILSVYPEDLYAIRVLKAGAAGYLNKTSATRELITAIERILAGKKYITPEIAEKLIDSPGQKKPHETLSKREFEIFNLMVAGKGLSEISGLLSLAISTVSTYRSRILDKLGVSNNADLLRYAISNKILKSA